jgi:hypothetical protein
MKDIIITDAKAFIITFRNIDDVPSNLAQWISIIYPKRI